MIASSTAAAGGLSAGLGIVWIVVLFGIMYFMMIRPQKKEQKRTQTMLNSMEVGDSVVTTSGFYGVVIDMTEEDLSLIHICWHSLYPASMADRTEK